MPQSRAGRRLTHRQGQWQLRAEVVHWRGETGRAGASATSVFDIAAAALRGCQLGVAAESPSVTVDEPNRLSAVVSGPTVLHTYLVAHPENSTISELALWTTDPVAAALADHLGRPGAGRHVVVDVRRLSRLVLARRSGC